MSLMSEFKAFAMRGNVVDLAVGVVIGAAFGKIVSSLTESMNVDAFKVGTFLQTVLDFAIIAFVIFLVIKAMNAVMRKEAAAPPAPSPEQVLLTEIRDLLKAR